MSSEEISIDSANFVLLSLIRELYNLAEQSTPIEAKEYKKQIKQIQTELKYLEKKQLIQKIKNYYAPYLKKLQEQNHV